MLLRQGDSVPTDQTAFTVKLSGGRKNKNKGFIFVSPIKMLFLQMKSFLTVTQRAEV